MGRKLHIDKTEFVNTFKVFNTAHQSCQVQMKRACWSTRENNKPNEVFLQMMDNKAAGYT